MKLKGRDPYVHIYAGTWVAYIIPISIGEEISLMLCTQLSQCRTQLNMKLLISGIVAVILFAIVDDATSQSSAITPLWPCYSVFKVSLGMNMTTMSTYYRYTSRFVTTEGEVYDPNNPDCVFTFEGPPNSRIQLQLFNVLIQSPGYVSTSLHSSGNCSVGAVRIYNFTITGALVQVNEVCSSFQTGVLLQSDTNVAVVTHTVARGHFELQVTVIPYNNTFRSGQLVRSFPGQRENVILLGHTDREINLLSNLMNSPQLGDQSNNSQEDNSNDYYDEYTDMNSNEIIRKPSSQKVNKNDRNEFHKGSNNGQNKISNLHNQSLRQTDQQNKQKNKLNIPPNKLPIQDSDQVNRLELYDLRNQLAQQDEILNLLTSNKFSALKNELNKPSGGEIKDQSNKMQSRLTQQQPDNLVQPNLNPITQKESSQFPNIQVGLPINSVLGNHLTQMQQDQLNQLLNIPVRNQISQEKGPNLNLPQALPLISQFNQEAEKFNQFSTSNKLAQNQPESFLTMNQLMQQLISQNQIPKIPDQHTSFLNMAVDKADEQQQIIDSIKSKLNELNQFQGISTLNNYQVQQLDKSTHVANQKQNMQPSQKIQTSEDQNEQLKQLLNQLVHAASNLVPVQHDSESSNKQIPTNAQNSQSQSTLPTITKPSQNSKSQNNQQQEHIQGPPSALSNQTNNLLNKLAQTLTNLMPHQNNIQSTLTNQMESITKKISKDQETHKNDLLMLNTNLQAADTQISHSNSGEFTQIHDLMHLIRNQVTEQKDQINQPTINQMSVNSRVSESNHGSVEENAELFQATMAEKSEPTNIPSEHTLQIDEHNQKIPMSLSKINSQSVHRENSKFSERIMRPQALKATEEHKPLSRDTEVSKIEPTVMKNLTKIIKPIQNPVPRYIQFLDDSMVPLKMALNSSNHN